MHFFLVLTYSLLHFIPSQIGCGNSWSTQTIIHEMVSFRGTNILRNIKVMRLVQYDVAHC